ncbi:MAG: DUF3786 domain-containing protein [Treponema sp.]|jgi:hypothetical protein|nr:DUF3786 domain-containing protein [Treponema sp.]
MSNRAVKNQKEEVPFFHYLEIYKNLNPQEIAGRCGLLFDKDISAFRLRFMGIEYQAPFPDFALQDKTGSDVKSLAEKILILHYLCEGRYVDYRGNQRSYQEIPWGGVYYPNFRGRCILRFAHTFGNDLITFKRIMEETKGLQAEPLKQGDAGYRFEFLTGLYMSLLLWAGDEEFPASAQILFDDNFEFAFTAEDIAVVGEIVVSRLKALRNK